MFFKKIFFRTNSKKIAQVYPPQTVYYNNYIVEYRVLYSYEGETLQMNKFAIADPYWSLRNKSPKQAAQKCYESMLKRMEKNKKPVKQK